MDEPRGACLHREYPSVQVPGAGGQFAYEVDGSFKDADVDIIAVQGLASTYERTWSVEINSATKERYHWLRDRLPRDLTGNDIRANIYAFEYPSAWYDGDPDYTDLEECGRQLLACIERQRCHAGTNHMCLHKRDRPIVFIGHSFGGLVIKQAILLADQMRAVAPNLGHILSSVASTIFLGTPHRGTTFSTWAMWKMAAGRLVVGTYSNPELITLLELDSALLRYIQSSFSRLRKSNELSDLGVYCFFEKKQLSIPPERVVSERSACLDDAENAGLDSNHMELNKFPSGPNENYNTLYTAIREACMSANEIVPPRLKSRVYNSTKASPELKDLRRWLAPSLQQKPQLNRKLQVHRSNNTSCKWLLEQDFFKSWSGFEPRKNILWMTGIPGSGKSVLAAFTVDIMSTLLRTSKVKNLSYSQQMADTVCADCRNARTQPSVLYFFGGVDRTHETSENILGTLIDQLLSLHSENDTMLSMVLQSQRETRTDSTAETLLDLLSRLVSLVAPVSIIIDAIDEMAEAADCLSMLGRLCTDPRNPKVNLFLFSQTTRMLRETDARLFAFANVCSITDYTSGDISKFIDSQTQELLKTKPEFSPQEDHIRQSLSAKANGMFQYVKPAMDQLAQGARAEELDSYLDDLPSEQANAWESVFARLGSRSMKSKKTIRQALMWLCAAPRPLSATELHYALNPVTEYTEIRALASQSPAAIVEHDAQFSKELQSLLEPLVDVSTASNSLHYFQVAHSTVRTALCASGSLGSSSVQSWIGFSIEEAHCEVATSCMALCAKSVFVMANSFGSQLLFAIDYAWEHWAYHLKLSRADMANEAVKDAFERMIIGVLKDTAVFLCALADFLASPQPAVTWTDADLARVVCFQRAEKSLTNAMESVGELRTAVPVTQQLQQIKTNLQQFKMLDIPVVETKVATRLARYIDRTTGPLKEAKTTVHTIKGEEKAQSTPVGRQILNEACKKHWQVVKDLRSLALRLAVNPLYGALMFDAKSDQFSPINTLVQVSGLLEEVGSYPYWEDLPVKSEASDAFVTAPDDPQHGPARFVMHSMIHQNSFDEQSSSEQQENAAPAHFQAHQPDRRLAADDFAISDSHKALVKKVHELPHTTMIVLRTRLQTFRPQNRLLEKWVFNPVGNWHVHDNLMLYGKGNTRLSLENDPTAVMMHYVPPATDSEIRRSLIQALPQLLSTIAVQFVMYLFVTFSGISQRAFAAQHAALQMAKLNVQKAWGTFKASFNPDSYVDLQHCLAALFLYGLRAYLLPQIGASIRVLRWKELTYCFGHPAQYLEVLRHSDWSIWNVWTWFRYIQYMFHLGVGTQAIPAAVTLAVQPDHSRRVVFFLLSFGIYQTLLNLEEAVYSVLFSLATSLATGLVMFHDADRIQDLILYSFSFWWHVGIGVFIGLASTMAAGARTYMIIVYLLPQLFGLWLLSWIGSKLELGSKLWALVAPLIRPFSQGLQDVMQHYGRFVQLSLTAAFLFTLWRCFWVVDGWIWDPYDTKTSRTRLALAYHKVRATIEAHQIKSIGAAPFGGEQQHKQALPEMPGARRMTNSQHTARIQGQEHSADTAEGAQQTTILQAFLNPMFSNTGKRLPGSSKDSHKKIE